MKVPVSFSRMLGQQLDQRVLDLLHPARSAGCSKSLPFEDPEVLGNGVAPLATGMLALLTYEGYKGFSEKESAAGFS